MNSALMLPRLSHVAPQALPIEMPVDDLNMGDVVDIYPYEGVTKRHGIVVERASDTKHTGCCRDCAVRRVVCVCARCIV